MRLDDILNRQLPPEPWAEGDKIPWDDPDFSRRMLQEHLSQAHDLASRRAPIIDQHVVWINQALLNHRPGRVLDLGCGPGLYTSRLASLGHHCEGIDFSPAAIEYARARATAEGQACTYRLGDIRDIDYGEAFDLAMLIFGEFNTFRRSDALKILRKARKALTPTGCLLLEAHTYEFVEASGRAGTSWRSSSGGLFSTRPHLVLSEHFWHELQHAATERTFVIDGETSAVDRYVGTMQAYTADDYTSLLEETGLVLERSLPALPGSPETGEYIVLVASTV